MLGSPLTSDSPSGLTHTPTHPVESGLRRTLGGRERGPLTSMKTFAGMLPEWENVKSDGAVE